MGWNKDFSITQIYFALDEIRLGIRDIKAEFCYEKDMRHRLKKFLSEAWHNFLEQVWFAPSYQDLYVTSDFKDPISVAIQSYCKDILLGIDKIDDETEEEESKSPPFDPLEFNSLESLLYSSDAGQTGSALFRIYRAAGIILTETTEREFRDRFHDLRKTVHNLMGSCYNEFLSHESYTRAYLMRHILSILYRDHNPYRPLEEQSVVTRWLVSLSFHHDIAYALPVRSGITLQEISDIYAGLLTSEGAEKKFNIVRAAIILSGDKFHEANRHEKTIEILSQDDDLKERLEEIKALMDPLVEKHTESRKAQSKEFNDNKVARQLSIFRGYY
jgi:hypothetical protein